MEEREREMEKTVKSVCVCAVRTCLYAYLSEREIETTIECDERKTENREKNKSRSSLNKSNIKMLVLLIHLPVHTNRW